MSVLSEFFTNNEATANNEVAVKSPAFSLTKVWGALTAAIAAVGAGLPALTGADDTIKVAAIAAGTVAFVAFLGLGAVDLIVRQRASQAKLQWGSAAAGTKAGDPITLLPDQDTLVLQATPQGDEYGIKYVELEGQKVTVVARRKGETLAPTFQPR